MADVCVMGMAYVLHFTITLINCGILMVNGLMSSATSISAINCVFVIASGIVVLYKRFDHFFTYRDVG